MCGEMYIKMKMCLFYMLVVINAMKKNEVELGEYDHGGNHLEK